MYYESAWNVLYLYNIFTSRQLHIIFPCQPPSYWYVAYPSPAALKLSALINTPKVSSITTGWGRRKETPSGRLYVPTCLDKTVEQHFDDLTILLFVKLLSRQIVKKNPVVKILNNILEIIYDIKQKNWVYSLLSTT